MTESYANLVELYTQFRNKFCIKCCDGVNNDIINNHLKNLLIKKNTDAILEKIKTDRDYKYLIYDEIENEDIDDLQYRQNVLTVVPMELKLPIELQIFYNLYDDMYLYKKDSSSVCFYEVSKIRNSSIVFLFNDEAILNYEDYDAMDLILNVGMYDWYEIFFDCNSMDNGCGSIHINLNPKSDKFGHIYCFSSSDSGILTFIGNSFADIIKIILNSKDFDINRDSICDLLNGLYK